MSGLVGFLLLVAGVVWWVRRRRRKAVLAGLTSERPVFHVEPPRRRLSSIKGERL